MRVLTALFILVFLFLMLVGQSYYETDENFSIYNFTEEYLVWNYTYEQKVDLSNNLTIYPDRVNNLINSFVDWAGFSLIELSKWSLEFGYNNPEYNYENLKDLLWIYLWVLVIVSLFPIIIPLIALIYLLFVGLKYLLTTKWWKNGFGISK